MCVTYLLEVFMAQKYIVYIILERRPIPVTYVTLTDVTLEKNVIKLL